MNCSNIRPLLSAYYDNDVSTEERTQVERHLAGCQDCRRALAEFRAIGSDIRSMAIPQPPAGLRRDVWRAIEARQTNPRVFSGRPARGVATTLPQPKERSFLPNVVRGMGRGWATALPAALLIGGLLLVLSVLLLRNNPSIDVASLVEKGEISSYSEPIHVQLDKEVVQDECESNITVSQLLVGTPVAIANAPSITCNSRQKLVTIQPNPQWEPGSEYQIYIDAPKVGLIAGEGSKLDSKSITLNFSAAMYTPTPTSTPSFTPIPTNTPVPPTNIPQPTSVAQNSPEPTQGQVEMPTSVPTRAVPPTQIAAHPSTTIEPKASPTVRVNPTNTAVVPPTNTSVLPTYTPVQEPTHTLPPTFTPVATPTVHVTQPVPTVTAIATATPHHGTPTATATPRGGASPTPTPVNTACDQVPVRGFGKIWQSNLALQERIGCPAALEMAIPNVVVQHFQGGVMVWRDDIKRIYVFINNPSNPSGIWLQFADTWQDTDTAVHVGGTPTPGLFEPVRGFGKLWNENGYVRQSLGWATDQETGGLTGAWQEFEHGEALWTSDLNIYFMYNDDSFQHFVDTWVGPGGE